MRRLLFIVLPLAGILIAAVLVQRNTSTDPLENATPAADTGAERATTATPATAPTAADVEEIIEARRVLMQQVERHMKPIDEFTVTPSGDLAALRSAGQTIEAMMLAFPHLFPPATNRYDATVRESPTSALPQIWKDQAAFRTLAAASEQASAAIAAAGDAASLRTAARALRASCDGCHVRFMKAYTPPTVTQEDRDVDFDSVFQGK